MFTTAFALRAKKSSSRELMLFTMRITRDDRTKHAQRNIEVNGNGWTRKQMIGRTEKNITLVSKLS